MTEIFLKSTELAGGVRQYDLISKDMPINFLGLAADLNFEQPFEEKDFLGTEDGTVFTGDSVGKPIIMAKALSEKGKLIFGITRKAQEISFPLPDGVLFSFRVTSAMPMAKGIEKEVFSVFEGGRKDLRDVIWRVESPASTENTVTGTLSRQEALPSAMDGKSQENITGEVTRNSTMVSVLPNEAALWEVLNVPISAGVTGFWTQWWLILLTVVVLGGVVAVGLLLKLRKAASPEVGKLSGEGQIKLDY